MYQRSGNIWEKRILTEGQMSGGFIYKIPEQIKYNVRKKTMYRLKTPFDYIYCQDGRSCYLDAKAVASGTFNLTTWSRDYYHQYLSLLEAYQRGGVNAGLLIHFYTKKKIWFFHIRYLQSKLKEGEKSVSSDRNKNAAYFEGYSDNIEWDSHQRIEFSRLAKIYPRSL